MKSRSITFKLFIITVIFFASFYGIVMMSQLFFFKDFYQEQKINKVEHDLAKLAKYYADEEGNSSLIARKAIQFMGRNRSQLTVVNMDGQLITDDPYHMTIKQPDGNKIFVSLSLFMALHGDELRATNINKGDQLTLWGEKDIRGKDFSTILFPDKIYKQNFGMIGEDAAPQAVRITGVVNDIVLPGLKTWNQRQGLLMQALYQWFPLTNEQTEQLRHLQMQKIEWIEPWSGTNNVIIIQPVKKHSGEIELIFSLTSLQEISDTNEALRLFYMYLGIGGFVFILILSLIYSKMLTRPLIALNEMAKRMVHFDFKAAKPIHQNDELGNLSSSLITMSKNLDQALSELKEANQRLQEDMEQKQKMEMIQQGFFSNASHELKTPLSIVKSFAEGLRDGVNLNKRDHYVSVIIEEAEKMEMLIKDMLDLARLESGTIQLRKKSFLLSELVEKVSDKLVYLLEKKRLEIMVIPVNELPVLADPEWMEQVILNFIVNAIRHAEEGSTITIEIQSDTHASRLSVDNVGETIPEDQQRLIWGRFYRAEASRSRQTGGTGLGLSIAKLILDMHACEYGVTNLENGVRFFITFNN